MKSSDVELLQKAIIVLSFIPVFFAVAFVTCAIEELKERKHKKKIARKRELQRILKALENN